MMIAIKEWLFEFVCQWHEYFIGSVLIGILVAIHRVLWRHANRPLNDEEYLAHLAGTLECSEWALFELGGKQWQVTDRRIESDFRRYILGNGLPHYMNDFVRLARSSDWEALEGLKRLAGRRGEATWGREISQELKDEATGLANGGESPETLKSRREWPSQEQCIRETLNILVVFAIIAMVSTFLVRAHTGEISIVDGRIVNAPMR